jgi:hypothetical protein
MQGKNERGWHGKVLQEVDCDLGEKAGKNSQNFSGARKNAELEIEIGELENVVEVAGEKEIGNRGCRRVIS